MTRSRAPTSRSVLLHGKIHAAYYDKTGEADSRNEAFNLCAQFIKDIGLSVNTKILSATFAHYFHIKQAVSLMMELLGKKQAYNTLSEILGKRAAVNTSLKRF